MEQRYQPFGYASIFESYRPEIEAELKKVIGRKLTNDEWLYLIRETWGKVQVDREQEQFRHKPLSGTHGF